MANPRSTKRDIDRVKKERAARKRERRQQSRGESEDATIEAVSYASSGAGMAEAEVLEALNLLHVRYDAGELSFDEFEASKDELFHRLGIQ